MDNSFRQTPLNPLNKNQNNNNGLLPRIWGPHVWKSLHCISFGYPINPSYEKKCQYRDFFKIIGHVLPCSTCSESYNNFISSGDTILNDEVLESRYTLT